MGHRYIGSALDLRLQLKNLTVPLPARKVFRIPIGIIVLQTPTAHLEIALNWIDQCQTNILEPNEVVVKPSILSTPELSRPTIPVHSCAVEECGQLRCWVRELGWRAPSLCKFRKLSGSTIGYVSTLAFPRSLQSRMTPLT